MRTPANRHGFSLIELMIVIAIIGILVAVALPQLTSMTEDAKRTKARQDCDTICQAIQKYNSLEGQPVERLMDLQGRYMTGMSTLRDPWGNAYQIDVYGGNVYSKGPDGQDKFKAGADGTMYLDGAARQNKDNINVPYIGALTLVKATLEVNPNGEADPSQAFDVLHLHFNKRVKVKGTSIDLASASEVAPSEQARTGKSKDADDASAGGPLTKAFRWCEGSKNKVVSPATIFKTFTVEGEGTADLAKAQAVAATPAADDPADATIALYRGTAAAGTFYATEDNREIVIALGAGSSGSIIPGTHYLNLTGNRKNADETGTGEDRNPLFKEFNGVTGGEASGTPILVTVHD